METNTEKNQPMADASVELEDKIPTAKRVNEDSAQALDLVPSEIWVKIFAYVNQDELLKSISLVYKNWFQIVTNERKSLTIQGKNNSKNNSKNIADVQSLLNRFPNLKELILKHKLFWITKESPILPLNFSDNPYLVKVVVWTVPSIDFLQGEHCVYKLKEEDFENGEESTEEYRFAIKNTKVNRFCMNPKENEICVDNMKPENVRHLGLSLHFEHCKQNDVWPEKLIEELSHLPEILKEKNLENLESIDIDYVPTMSNGWTTIPQMYINAIDNFDKVLLGILELEISILTIGFGALGNMIEIRSNALKYPVINYHIKELKLKSWDGGSWTKDIMRRLIQSLPNLEVLAIDTATTIIDGEAIQNWDVLLDIVKYVSDCKKLRCLRFDLMDQLSFIPFLVKFGEWHEEQSCCDNNDEDTQESEEEEENIKEEATEDNNETEVEKPDLEKEAGKKGKEIGDKNMEDDEKEVENHDANYESSEFEDDSNDDSDDDSEPDDSGENWIENDPSNERIGELAQEALEIIERTFPVEAEIKIRQFRYNDPASNNVGMKIRMIVSKEKGKIAKLGKLAPKEE